MDLDKLKETWQSAEIRSSINEGKIQQMLDNRGKTALEKLIRYEKRFFWLYVGCILFLPMFWSMNIVLFAIYLISIILGCIWQQYKYMHIKDTDLLEMDVLTVSSRITNYKKYIFWEFIIGLVYTFLFIVLLVLTESGKLGKDILAGNTFAQIYIVFILLLLIACAVLVYYRLYWKNISAIQNSITEIKSFEIDNK